MERLAQMVSEIMKDPLRNQHTGDRTREFAINSFYALPASEIADTISNNLESSGLSQYLKRPDGKVAFDKRDIAEMVNILRDGEILPKETLSRILSKENLTSPIDVKKIVKDVLRSLSREQASLLVEKISAKGPDAAVSLLEKGLSIERKDSGKPLSKEDVAQAVELVFEAGSKIDANARKTLFDRLGVDAKTAEFGISFLKAMGKERCVKIATDHSETVGELISGKLDAKKNPEKLVAIGVDILYASDTATTKKIFTEARTAFPSL
jgi:uncharacterized protein (DUF2267 family)